MNYFELFGIPVSLQVDPFWLRRRYYELSRQYHPDMHTRDSASEKAGMPEKAALVNEAFKVLGNRQLLLGYILELKGLLPEKEPYQLPQLFLMEMMDIHEKMMELELDPDPEAIAGLHTQVQEMEHDLYDQVQPLIAAYGDAAALGEVMEQLKELYFKQKYLLKIQEKLGTFASP